MPSLSRSGLVIFKISKHLFQTELSDTGTMLGFIIYKNKYISPLWKRQITVPKRFIVTHQETRHLQIQTRESEKPHTVCSRTASGSAATTTAGTNSTFTISLISTIVIVYTMFTSPISTICLPLSALTSKDSIKA